MKMPFRCGCVVDGEYFCPRPHCEPRRHQAGAQQPCRVAPHLPKPHRVQVLKPILQRMAQGQCMRDRQDGADLWNEILFAEIKWWTVQGI